MTDRNQKTYDGETGLVTITNPKGDVVMQRPARTPQQALVEFAYACKTWFACMDEVTRNEAIGFACKAAKEVPFNPNVVPR